MTMDKLFEIENLACSYDRHYRPGLSKVILEIRKLIIPKGKKVFIVGESGIGKSTILETLGMMNNTIVPDGGTKFLFYEAEEKPVDLVALWRHKDRELSSFRLRHFNFIFQSTNLMRNFTAYENIALTRMLQGYSQESSFERARQVMADLGLDHIDESRMTQELSGGQQQRLAFAGPSCPILQCFSATSRPATWTATMLSRRWSCFRTSSRNSTAVRPLSFRTICISPLRSPT